MEFALLETRPYGLAQCLCASRIFQNVRTRRNIEFKCQATNLSLCRHRCERSGKYDVYSFLSEPQRAFEAWRVIFILINCHVAVAVFACKEHLMAFRRSHYSLRVLSCLNKKRADIATSISSTCSFYCYINSHWLYCCID